MPKKVFEYLLGKKSYLKSLLINNQYLSYFYDLLKIRNLDNDDAQSSLFHHQIARNHSSVYLKKILILCTLLNGVY